jgi:hypothetical protein
MRSRRQAVLGGLVAGWGLVLALIGGVAATCQYLGVDTAFGTYTPFEDLPAGTVGCLGLGLGVGLMVAATIR